MADRVDRAARDLGAEQLPAELGGVAAGDPVADREQGDRRLQPGPEGTRANPFGQRCPGAFAAAGAAQGVGTMLGDGDRGRRQLGDLVAMGRGGEIVLARIEALPAAEAALRPVVDDLIQLRFGHELASCSLVAGLATLPAGTWRALGRWPLGRRVSRGWARGVLGALAQLLLKPLDPRLQPGHLALVAGGQLDQELDAGLAARVVDRLGLGALHGKKVRRAEVMSPWGAERLRFLRSGGLPPVVNRGQ